MKLATLPDGSADGRLHVVSRDLSRAAPAEPRTLQAALDDWERTEPGLRSLAGAVEAGTASGLSAFRQERAMAPLPRAWQWLDGSAFASHGALMQRVFGMAPIAESVPLMYQGMSDRFLGPAEDVPLPDEAHGIDFEGEFAVVTGPAPMRTSTEGAARAVRLILIVNDWSLRNLAPREMKTGFGWVQAKPACSASPVAATPDELGDAWRDGRVHLPLSVSLNGAAFGNAHGGAMAFGFFDLIAHAAATRSLPAGTIIGSGTVSNDDFRVVGSSCIAERRGIELLDEGAPRTPYMRFGDRVRMEALDADGGSVFGAIDQRVVAAG